MNTSTQTHIGSKQPRAGLTPGRALWIALTGLVALTLVTAFSEIQPVLDVLRSADLLLLLLALGVATMYALNLGEFYRTIFTAGGMPASRLRFLLISAASHSINMVSKTSGFGGLALYIREGRERGVSAARVGAAYLAAYVLGYVAYFVVLVAALILLATSGSLTRIEAGASALVLAIAILVAALLVAGYRKEAFLLAVALAVAGFVNRMGRLVGQPTLLSQSAVRSTVTELHAAVGAITERPAAYLRPLGHALGVELLSAVMLYVVARALGADIGPGVAMAGYAVSLLFMILSVTPAGLGFVEVSLTVFLVSFGVPRPEAVAVTLGYRFFDFWLPLLFGAASYLVLRVQHAAQS